MSTGEANRGSFRDPSGVIFWRDGRLYRQVNAVYQPDYDLLMESGLYEALVSAGLLVRHEEVDAAALVAEGAYKVLAPEEVPFISYPYEWCFSQLKDAALATLAIQEKALAHGMVLKDASAYNIQFVDAQPVFIDTLSFEKYEEGSPWVAYRQFCQHFLAPLALMRYRDVRLGQLLRVHMDGVPLDLCKALLPFRTKFNLGLATHIHLHAAGQARHADDAAGGDEEKTAAKLKKGKVSLTGLRGILDNLRSTAKKMQWRPAGTEWGDYYDDTNYTDDSFEEKRALVGRYVNAVKPGAVWDVGGNTGVFSRIASEQGIPTVSFDIDPAAIEKSYRWCKSESTKNLLPLVLDLTNPSPAIGWHHSERDSVCGRGPVDLAFALALVHHIAISNNVPLPRVAEFFADLCTSLIIEFVPKRDSQVRRLLASRADIFPTYTEEGFEAAFSGRFTIAASEKIAGTERTLYLMRRR
jgi:hypothetical protein